jgi:hypothetical protein
VRPVKESGGFIWQENAGKVDRDEMAQQKKKKVATEQLEAQLPSSVRSRVRSFGGSFPEFAKQYAGRNNKRRIDNRNERKKLQKSATVKAKRRVWCRQR